MGARSAAARLADACGIEAGDRRSDRRRGPVGPAGKRFGTLVHAVLAAVPLDATADEIRALAGVQARLLSAPPARSASGGDHGREVLRHPLLVAARRAARRAAACLREVPVSLVADGVLIDGQADLAFEGDDGWVVVDFKTDVEMGSRRTPIAGRWRSTPKPSPMRPVVPRAVCC